MGKIYCMMGKSSTGKDYLYREIRKRIPELKPVVPYTTRPIREGERDGAEYFFIDEEKLAEYTKTGKVIEQRAYQTVHGIWRYATIDDGTISLTTDDYLLIATLEAYAHLREYFGPENVVPLYIEVEDGERLRRALKREAKQEEPKYAEVCRRFLADTEDFSEENLKKMEIDRRFLNIDRETCISEIEEEIVNDRV